MGFKLAEATNAWCIRCTRGERRRFFLADALCVLFEELRTCGVLDFELEAWAVAEPLLCAD